MVMTGNNTYGGSTVINGGTIRVSSLSDEGGVGSLGTPLNVDGNASDAANVERLVFNGGSLEYVGSGETTVRSFTVGNGGAKFVANGTGALVFSSAAKLDFANTTPSGRSLLLDGANTSDNMLAPTLLETEAAGRAFSSIVKNGVGTWIIGSAASFLEAGSAIDINAGVLGFTAGAFRSGADTGLINVANGGALRWDSGNTNDLSARLRVASGATATFDFRDTSATTFATGLNLGNAAVVKAGPGPLNLSVANTFSGGLTVSGGTVTASNAQALGSGPTNVDTTGKLNLSVAVANNVTVSSGGFVTGTATTSGTLTLNNGGHLATPGTAIGTYAANNVVVKSGAVLEWKVYDTVGGSGVGYDRFTFANLDLSSIQVGDAKAKIVVTSVSNVGGAAGDSNLAGSFSTPAGIVHTFNFGTVSGDLNLAAGQSITDVFSIDVSGFSFAGGGLSSSDVWSMSFDGSALTLTAVPEPSTYGFVVGALSLAAAAIRRRRKKAVEAKSDEA
jgi:fibronectin-binding autotransporter adhesin